MAKINFRPTEYVKPIPIIQLTSLIDILFVNLAFFMAMFVYFNFETQLNISVPEAVSSTHAEVAPQEIVVNIMRDGGVVVNQKRLSLAQLGNLLKKTSQLYPAQPIIIRADQKTYHEHVVRVLDACAKAKIWNISFATTK